MGNILNPSECAKTLRKILKDKYTETFNVSTNTIDGLARIKIEWENGVSYDEIKNLTAPYIYKDNDESDNGIEYKCKYIMINRMFTSNILESLTNVLIGDKEIIDEDRDKIKAEAKSILLRHIIPYCSTKVLSYDIDTDTIVFNNNKIVTENTHEVKLSAVEALKQIDEKYKPKQEKKERVSDEYKSLITEVDGIKVIKYSEKSFILVGENTVNYKAELIQLQGRFNNNLSFEGEKVKGWVFSTKRINSVKELLKF
jgi:hypothetical protein